MMSPEAHRTLLCGIRTAGLVALVGVTWWGAHYVGWSYDDTRVILGMINAYFVELIWLATYAAMGFAFYKASVSDNDFHFIHFFKTGPDHQEDLTKFAVFVLLVNCCLILFTLAWRDKELATALTIILGAFVLKGGVETVGRSWGKQRSDQPTQGEKP